MIIKRTVRTFYFLSITRSLQKVKASVWCEAAKMDIPEALD